MRHDPQTKVASLLVAIPSAALAFNRLGLIAQGNENKSLEEVCRAGCISLEEFMRVMNEIDWNNESPREESGRV